MVVCLDAQMYDLEIKLDFLELLKNGRNLLAFSGGVDSSALYFLLKKNGIPFDVAIVDYGLRRQSSLEVSYAQNLCFRDKRQCFIQYAPKIQANFESNARQFRYGFFEELIAQFGYTNLILAHQLNDSLEWFLMQFCKGTSLSKMRLSPQSKRVLARNLDSNYKEIFYFIVRPLWQVSRAQILQCLTEHQIFYFEDSSNSNMGLKRNYFREKYSNALLEEFQSGISFSLRLLEEDLGCNPLKGEIFEILTLGKFCVLSLESLQGIPQQIEAIDEVCKECGILLSRPQRLELKEALGKEEFSFVFQARIAIEKRNNRIFFSPDLQESLVIPKAVREKYRKLWIPKRFRIFLFKAANLGLEQKILDKIPKTKEKE